MEAVLWLEEYLGSWDKILFFVCHSQDFMNNVCTHIVRLDLEYKKLRYYSGNYDSYVKTRRDQDMVQMRQYEAEQRDIAEIKDFIARFGHGTVKMVRQAQAREKLLQKKLEAGLTDPPEKDPEYDWSFPDAGQLPVPVLSVERVSFGYPGGQELYSEVDFGIDLQTRVALVGPNGMLVEMNRFDIRYDDRQWRSFFLFCCRLTIFRSRQNNVSDVLCHGLMGWWVAVSVWSLLVLCAFSYPFHVPWFHLLQFNQVVDGRADPYQGAN